MEDLAPRLQTVCRHPTPYGRHRPAEDRCENRAIGRTDVMYGIRA